MAPGLLCKEGGIFFWIPFIFRAGSFYLVALNISSLIVNSYGEKDDSPANGRE
jgi:hypothetical protein